MEQIKFIWHDNGKHKSNSLRVSIREFTDYGVFDVISPTDIVGTGSCYGDALADFTKQFDEYVARLQKFRDEVILTTKAYTDTVEVDCCGSPVPYSTKR